MSGVRDQVSGARPRAPDTRHLIPETFAPDTFPGLLTPMLQGLPVSPGVAVGRAVIVRFGGLPAFRRAVAPDEFDEEEKRLRRASRFAAQEFRRHSGEAAGDIGTELAAILEAHGLIASDETYLEAVLERVRRDRVNAEWALAEVTRELGKRFETADSDAMRERAADIHDVAREITRHLTGGADVLPQQLPRGSILVADEISPVDASRLDPRRVRALVLERGGPTSHATIIARSFGLPAVVGIAGVCEAVSPEKPIVVDGDRGTVETNPSKERLRRSLLRVREGRDRARRQRARTSRAASTRDGVRIVVRANLELAERSGRSIATTRRGSDSSAPSSSTSGQRPDIRASKSSARFTRACSPRRRRTRSSFAPTTSAARRESVRLAAKIRRSASAVFATVSHTPSSSRRSWRRCASRRAGDRSRSSFRW